MGIVRTGRGRPRHAAGERAVEQTGDALTLCTIVEGPYPAGPIRYGAKDAHQVEGC